ncbi:MAG: hypothetical protein MI757_22170 [Pirellulales bacterium]|nr:hypothetical protein [Pirellulales bacterium]
MFRTPMIVAVCLVCTGAPAIALAESDRAAEIKQHVDTLEQHKIGSDSKSLIRYLQNCLPSADLQSEIAKYVKQLDSEKFAQREAASAKLAQFGAAARAKVLEASKSENEETTWRAKRILQQIESGKNLQQREVLAYAAIRLIEDKKLAEATPVLLKLVDHLEQTEARDAAVQAIWKCADKSHADLLEEAMKSSKPVTQAAAIVALEVAQGAAAVEQLKPFLKSESEVNRLAAARALANHKPRAVVEALVDLIGSKDEETSALAEALLRQLTGVTIETAEGKTIAAAWREWADSELATVKLKTLGAERLDLSHGRGSLTEMFTRKSTDATKGYGRLGYEATVPARTIVADGILRMEYGGTEGDQRLAITSQKLTGRREWPKKLEIRAKMGGEADGSGTYHVGISIGQVKVLYHPAYSGGAFRVEDVDSHDYFTSGNKSMGFTPAAGAAQDVTIRVTRTEAGAKFDIEIKQGASTFRDSIDVSTAQLGNYNRIGLERSGRSGGAALFDSFSVKLGR